MQEGSHYVVSFFVNYGFPGSKLHEREYTDLLELTHVGQEYKLVWNPGQNAIMLEGAESPTVLDTEFACYSHVEKLVQHVGVPFYFTAWCLSECVITLKLYVDSSAIMGQWQQKRFFTGEPTLTSMFHKALYHKILYVAVASSSPPPPPSPSTPQLMTTRKRKRADAESLNAMPGSSSDASTTAAKTGSHESFSLMLNWMRALESRVQKEENTILCDKTIVIPGSSIVFSLDEMVFMSTVNESVVVPFNAGFIFGERNAGKSLVVKALLESSCSRASASASAPSPTPTPSSSSRIGTAASLLVVPYSLVHQWRQYFTGAVCIYNVSSFKKYSRRDIQTASVVIVTHKFFLGSVSKLDKTGTDEIKCRIVAAVGSETQAVDADALKVLSISSECTGGDQTELNVEKDFMLHWFDWQRIVVDEMMLFAMEAGCPVMSLNKHVFHPRYHSKMWWGLQGDVHPHSVVIHTLLSHMCSVTNNYAPYLFGNVYNINRFLPTCMYFAEALASVEVPYYHDRMYFTELNPHERCVYDTLVHLDADPEFLIEVCCGDLSFMKRYMSPESSWVDVIPKGIEAINECLIFTEGDDGADGAAGSASASADAEGSMDSSVEEVVEGGDGGEGGEGGEGGDRDRDQEVENDNDNGTAIASAPDAESQNATELLLQIAGSSSLTLDAFLQEHAAEISERREYFIKTTTQLSNGTLHASVCAICIVNNCDCIFVCGHMLCHQCTIDLFHSTRDEEYPDLMSPCPTCRWNIEPHEVFWVLPSPLRPSSKFDQVVKILNAPHSTSTATATATATATGSVVIFATSTYILHQLYRQLVQQKHMPSPLSKMVKHNVTWLHQVNARAKVLLIPYFRTFGLKLHNVSTVIFLHSFAGSVVDQQLVEKQALGCIVKGSTGMLTVCRLKTLDTVETPRF